MAEQTTEVVDDEVAKLRARVKRLEAERDRLKKDDDDDSNRVGRRVADSVSDAGRSKFDTATRVARGMTLASVEFVRLVADSVASFGDEVIERNESRAKGSRNVRHLAGRLPEDMAEGFADTLDRFSDIPARAAERYSKTYRQGRNTSRQRDESDDD